MIQDLTICIPAYNEAAAVKVTLEKLRAKFDDAEIILVDDGLNLVELLFGTVFSWHPDNRCT